MILLTAFLLALADADPLGVNVNVTFDEVGGLDDRKFAFKHYSSQLTYRRHSFVEGDDSSPSALPRSISTIQRHSPSRCAISRSPGDWKDPPCARACRQLSF